MKAYSGWKEGSPLNNFLAKHSAHKSLVFIDEFDKMGSEAQKTLLLPLEGNKILPDNFTKLTYKYRNIY